MKGYCDLDLMLNKLKELRLDPLEEDPSGNRLVQSRIWYNSSENVFKYFDGEEIKVLSYNDYLSIEDIDTIWDLVWS